MPQHDMNFANQSFPSMRSDMNNAVQALVSNNSGATAPSTTFANQLWYDTTANQLKIRNNTNSAWLLVAKVDLTNGFFNVTHIDPTGLTALTSLDLANDLLSVWDASTNRAKKLSLQTLATRIASGLPQNVRNFTIENDPVDTEHDIEFKRSDTGVSAYLVMRDAANNETSLEATPTPITKRIDLTWGQGDDVGGMAAGVTVSADTAYYCFILADETGSTIDAGFDTSKTAANLLADASVTGVGLTRACMVGAVITDASANILNGDYREIAGGALEFLFDSSVTQFSISSPASEALTAYTFPAPPESYPLIEIETNSGTTGRKLLIEMQEIGRTETDKVHDSGAYGSSREVNKVDYIRLDSARQANIARTQAGGYNGDYTQRIKGWRLKR